MTEEQLEALKEYVSALIDEKIEDAFHREAGIEYLKRRRAEETLSALIVPTGETDD